MVSLEQDEAGEYFIALFCQTCWNDSEAQQDQEGKPNIIPGKLEQLDQMITEWINGNAAPDAVNAVFAEVNLIVSREQLRINQRNLELARNPHQFSGNTGGE